MRKRFGAWTATAVFVGATALGAQAAESTAQRFEKIKTLAGDWIDAEGDGSVAASYRVTAGGSAVVETMLPGTPYEMVTVFTIDKDDLVLTHYCAQGNQPHMKAIKGGEAGTIAFKFDGGGNMKSTNDGHMHDATFTFVDADHVKSTWQYYKDGKPGEKAEFSHVRKKS